jgi:hypothetical protein
MRNSLYFSLIAGNSRALERGSLQTASSTIQFAFSLWRNMSVVMTQVVGRRYDPRIADRFGALQFRLDVTKLNLMLSSDCSRATIHKADSLLHGGHEDSSRLLCLRRSNQMNPFRRELLNGLLVLVVASLLSVAFSAFQVSFNAQLWMLILMGIAIAVTGYILFEITLGAITSAEDRERAIAESARQREEEWLKRVGTPARMELNQEDRDAGMEGVIEQVRSMKPGSDLTTMYYVSAEGGSTFIRRGDDPKRQELYSVILEKMKRGNIREYKRIMCFDHDVLANDPELRSGVLRVGEGPGTIDRLSGDHCRLLMETRGCFLFVAPAVFRGVVVLCGQDKLSLNIEMVDQATGGRTIAGVMFFCEPPNGEIIEQFRQMERETERRMVAVHKIRFPEDATPAAVRATL